MKTISPDRTPHASATTADETDILYKIAELKLSMTNENVNVTARTNRKKHNSNLSQRYGNIYSQSYVRSQNFNNQNQNNQCNSNQGQNQRTGHNNCNFPARQINNSNTLCNRNFSQNNSNALSNNVQFVDEDSQEMINSISNYFVLNY